MMRSFFSRILIENTKRIANAALFLVLCASGIWSDNIELDTKIPLGLAYDGSILWVTDAQNRTLSGYNFTEKKNIAPRTLAYDVRDLAFWQPNLVTVAPNFVYVINPINGDLLDKIPLKGIDDPVAIALDMHQAYIYNRSDKKIHRVHLVDRMQFGAFTPEVDSDIRSMTFYKGFLWAIAKDGKAYKLSPTDGTLVSFLPLPQSTYGIVFVDGGMYVSRPKQIRSIDFIETENYVAAARRNFTLTADLSITLPWRDEDRLRESKMTVRYAVLPMTAHQRLMGLRATPAVRFSRLDDGAHAAEIMIEQKSTEKTRSYKLQFQATLFNLTHIFNGPVLRQYFKNPTLPEAVRPYVDSLELSPHERTAVEKFRTEWLKRNEGKHPIYAIAAAERDTGLEPSTRCAIYRSLGIPCRRMIFYDLDQKALHTYSQVYIQPTGWVTITPQYSSARPKEFPIANNELELFSPDSVTIHPKPRASTKLSPLPPMSELLKFSNIRIVTSSIE